MLILKFATFLYFINFKGSVWWKNNSINALRSLNDLNSHKKIIDILKLSFSMALSPIWMDNSTTIECSEIIESK